METKYPNLLSPYQVGNVIFKNRMLAGPLGFCVPNSGGCIHEHNLEFYEIQATGGAARVTTNDYPVSGGMGPGGQGGPGGDRGPSGQGGPSNGQGSELPVDGNSEPPAMPDDTQNNQLTGNAAQASQSGSATSQTIQPSDGNPQTSGASNTQASTGFYMQDTVNAFSGVTAAA